MLYYLIKIDWLAAYHNKFFDIFFKIFPYLASDITYFLIVALGYWLSASAFFRDLGIYVCVSTLVNTVLKAAIANPRPASSLMGPT